MQAEYCFVIPCYNRFEYLRECIESLRSQTVRTWEAVLVDDGSTDGDIASVVAGFSDSRLKWIRHEKKCGPGAARNTGFRNTDSKLIVQVDGDDRISPEYLAHMGKLFKDDEMLDCAYPDLQLFGAEQGRWCMDGKTDGTLLLRQTIPCGSVMMKRQLWERVGGYDEAPELVFGNEDWEFWLRAVEKGFQVRHLCEPLYDYRRYTGSTSLTLNLHESITREYIYLRHKMLYDRFAVVPDFLSQGCYTSACAYVAHKEYRIAFQLFHKGWKIKPDRNWLARYLLRHLPTPFSRVIKRMVNHG